MWGVMEWKHKMEPIRVVQGVGWTKDKLRRIFFCEFY